MLKIFIGYDHRQPVGYNVLQNSIMRHAKTPVALIPLVLPTLPMTRYGLTPFTYSRFLVPYLCNYEGWALFLDLDMLVRDDITQVFELANPDFDVMVVKNKRRFEWASMMLFNNNKCRALTPEFIDDPSNSGLHAIRWTCETKIGELPAEWNHCVGYDAPRPDAKLAHFTQGIPCFPETIQCEYSQEWHAEHKLVNSSFPWIELMGGSVHTKQADDGKVVPKLSEAA